MDNEPNLILIPLESITAKTFIFLQESNRLAKEEKSFAFTFSDPLFKKQLHIMTCYGVQKSLFIRVKPDFDKTTITKVNLAIATGKVRFEIIDNDLAVFW